MRRFGATLLLLLAAIYCLSGCMHHGERPTMLHWIEDAKGTLTPEEVIDRDLSTDWDTGVKYPNFGFTKSVVWLSIPFENELSVYNPKLLEVAFPLHDNIQVYLLDGKKVVKTIESGDQYPFAQRPLKHRYFLFPHNVPPNKKLRAVVRIETSDSMFLPVNAWNSNEFFAHDQLLILMLGIFFGFLSIMLIYNLFLYVSTRDINYLLYVFCTASMIFLQLSQKGVGYQYLWSNSPFFNHIGIPFTSYLAMVSSLLFIYNFLELKKELQPKTIIAFKLLIFLAVQGFIWTGSILITNTYLIPYSVLLMSTVISGVIVTTTVMGLLIYLTSKGSESARMLMIAWTFFLGGSVMFALGRAGVPLPSWIAENAMLVGSTMEAALISFALANQIKRERDARLDAQNAVLELKEKATQDLEAEVRERTHKLQEAMLELTTANQKLDNLSRMDSLTGLSNRRNFDQQFNEEWLNSSRLKHPMSLLMADIDHFKMINDTYGHLFGDQCLIQVAEILKRCVHRPRDLAARFGGEEFIIMLPNTDEEGALAISESIRVAIEKLRLEHEKQSIQFTISIGIATVIPSPEASFIDLNENADQALYLAKEGGRNQSVVYDSAVSELIDEAHLFSGVSL